MDGDATEEQEEAIFQPTRIARVPLPHHTMIIIRDHTDVMIMMIVIEIQCPPFPCMSVRLYVPHEYYNFILFIFTLRIYSECFHL